MISIKKIILSCVTSFHKEEITAVSEEAIVKFGSFHRGVTLQDERHGIQRVRVIGRQQLVSTLVKTREILLRELNNYIE